MPGQLLQETAETDRLLALSDGVIAIAITLLVLDLSVPNVPAAHPFGALPTFLAEQGSEFLGFVLSFLVVGLYWVLHRRTFVHIERHGRGVIYLNLVFLLFVAFVPYATSVFTAYPGRLGTAFLSAVLALTGFSLALVWINASKADLLQAGLGSRTVRIQAVRFLASPLVFSVAAVVAVFEPTGAILVWLLLIPIQATLESRLLASLD